MGSRKPSEGRQQKCCCRYGEVEVGFLRIAKLQKHMVDSRISTCSVFRLCQATTRIQPHMRHESHLELLVFAPVLLTSPDMEDMEDMVFPFLLCVCVYSLLRFGCLGFRD